ncbi:MAG: tetratricopeptide repeat protein [Cyclobacteriaceae bacterium]
MAGDLVYINILASTAWHSTYFYLIQNAINIVDANNTPYYSLKEILERDGHALRTEKFLAMQRDIQSAGDQLKKSGDKSIVEAGPNKGKFVYDVMLATDTLAVWYYIYHVSQLDWDNMGQTIQLSKGYFDYTKEGDAATSPVLKDLFVNVSATNREKNFIDYKRKIDLQLIKDWLKDANAMIDKKNYDDAIPLLEASVFLAEKIGETDQLGINIFRIGEVRDAQGEYNESLKAYKKAKQAFEKTNNKEYLAFALHRLARSYYYLKDYSTAAEKYQPALILRRELAEGSTGRTDLYNQLYLLLDDYGSNCLAEKNYQLAESVYQEALAAAKKSESKDNEGAALWNLGYTEFNGELDQQASLKNYLASMDIYLSLKDTASIQQLYRNTGKVYVKLEQYGKALEKYSARLKLL